MTTQEKNEYLNKGYTPDQVEEIRLGLEEGLDIERYEDKEFFALQMREIRLGLMDNLSVDVYARKDFDWFQMEEIRLGLKDELNVRLYAYPKVPYQTMRQLRLALIDGINLSKYVNLPSGVLKELRKAIIAKVDIVPYIEEKYDKEQLEQIRLCLENNIDIKPYLNPDYRGISIREIRLGLTRNLEVSEYATLDYNWRQMREIRKGMEHQVDISVYKNPLYDWRQMQEIRLGLEEGLDVSKYSSLMYPASAMAQRRTHLANGIAEEPVSAYSNKIQNIDYHNFEIRVSPDDMSAYIQLNGRPNGLTKSIIMDALEDRGIVKGIDEAAIESVIAGKSGSQPCLIAQGKAAEPGSDGYYEFFFRTEIKREPKVLEDGSLDYQDIDWFEQVKRGQKLAYYHDAENGEPGYTITGNEIPPLRGKQLSILYGKGFYLEQDKKTYVANVDGIVELDGTTMNVSNLLTLGEVTAYMGDVRFDGNVHVTGNIGNGCKIIARDDIIVDGFVEGATLEAGGNIILRRGVNAQNRGCIKAGKNIEGSFFESAKVIAGEDIKANYCLSSEIECEGTLKVAGRKSSILGGVTYVGKEINVHNVGNKAGVKTIIKLGISNDMIRRQIFVDNGIKENIKELDVLNKAYDDLVEKFPPEVRAEMELFQKVEGAIFTKKEIGKKLEAEKEEISKKIALSNKAKAVLSGDVSEGVVVEINGKRWFSTGVKNVVIKKDENGISMQMN